MEWEQRCWNISGYFFRDARQVQGLVTIAFSSIEI
jgi:hypothetical protein